MNLNEELFTGGEFLKIRESKSDTCCDIRGVNNMELQLRWPRPLLGPLCFHGKTFPGRTLEQERPGCSEVQGRVIGKCLKFFTYKKKKMHICIVL